jgi:probable phosphoglycerate mutase
MIYLLRHGTIEGHEEKRFIGQIDLPLDENGLRQARWWQKALVDIAFERVCCSDLIRSRETARIIAGDRGMHIDIIPQLREINLGDWDGLSVAEVRQLFPREYERMGKSLSSYRPGGGESFTDLQRRVVPAFERIVGESEGPILIAAHAGVNRVILCHVLEMPLANLFRLDQDYGSLNVIGCKDGSFRVRSVNLIPPVQTE